MTDSDQTVPFGRVPPNGHHHAARPAASPPPRGGFPRGGLQGAVVAVHVAVGRDTPPDGEAAARLHAVITYLQLRIEILRQRGQLDRISPEQLALTPALPARSTAKALIVEARDLLVPPRQPWQPAPEEADLGAPLPWYEPERGDTGMPVSRPPGHGPHGPLAGGP
jgi:hypothetical protein